MRNKGWGDKNRGGGEDPERVDRVSNKTPIGFFFFFFFLPSIFSEKQLIWLRLERVVEEFRHGNSFGYMVNGGREGERIGVYSSGTELANEIREFEYKLRRGHGEWDYGGVGKLFSFFFFYLRRERTVQSTDLFSNVVVVNLTTNRKFWVGDVFRFCHRVDLE